jgi:hypothetical protein
VRAFVLGTGRCGTTTFAKACESITNYTVGHETQARQVKNRLGFPDHHIEVDHRLAWFLGTIDVMYRDEPVYVHLTRNPDKVARSWAAKAKHKPGQAATWSETVIYQPQKKIAPLVTAKLMVESVNHNIDLFLKDKTKVVRMRIEDPHDAFDEFWRLIGAEGNRRKAHDELKVRHNALLQRRKK